MFEMGETSFFEIKSKGMMGRGGCLKCFIEPRNFGKIFLGGVFFFFGLVCLGVNVCKSVGAMYVAGWLAGRLCSLYIYI